MGTLRGAFLMLALTVGGLDAQTCTTQAKMTAAVRSSLSEVADELARSVQADDVAQVQSRMIAEFASGSAFAPTATLVQRTSSRVQGDELEVTQIFELDSSAVGSKQGSVTNFSCPLVGTTSEVDFAIPDLPSGVYGFAMVEAKGAVPWLLSFLVRQDAGQWELAGFYPRARLADGHDGLWYWKAARDYANADELWLAWLFYGEADRLLRPANFVTTTNLDRLRSEQWSAAPPELINGVSPTHPLVLTSSGDQGAATVYRFSGLAAEGSEDGKNLNLILYLIGEDLSNSAAAEEHSKAAARAMIDAHIELRQAFHSVWVFTVPPGSAAADGSETGAQPVVTEQLVSSIP
ncbi:MAG: hypothetical protein ACP5E5_05160 [Acidobacteriaceae bacterium]